MLEDSEAASKFVDTLIDAKLNGTEIEADVRQTLHNDLLHRLETRIIAGVLALLDQHEQMELEHLVDNNRIDEIEGYLTRHGVDLNQVLAGVMTEFSATYMGA